MGLSTNPVVIAVDDAPLTGLIRAVVEQPGVRSAGVNRW
jgi:hypothetical protein